VLLIVVHVACDAKWVNPQWRATTSAGRGAYDHWGSKVFHELAIFEPWSVRVKIKNI